jgi:NAD(P)-dependent dehydrogenase (short-subunit alcohol dehydrogenase family)
MKVAIITGASRGIGAGLVAGFRNSGYAVVGTSRSICPADASDYAGMAALHSVGRLGEISDVVDAILYLERATFVTGEVLHVDGGQAAGT